MIVLIINSILLGVGLAMDAFSVSVANGLREPNIKSSKSALIAGTFAAFQFFMPLIGWAFVRYLAQTFDIVYKIVPFVAFIVLAIIGGKMIAESLFPKGAEAESKELSRGVLFMQAIATSIDALSVGLTNIRYDFLDSLVSSLIIGVVTFIICFAGVKLGKKAGTLFKGKAPLLGGCILMAIAISQLVLGIVEII